MPTGFPHQNHKSTMLTKCIRFASIAMCCALVGCTNDPPKPSTPVPQRLTVLEQLAEVRKLNSQGDTTGALKRVRETLLEAPENVQAISMAMELSAHEKKFSDAGDLAFTLSAMEGVRSQELLVEKAFGWHLQGGDYASAEADLRKAIQNSPTDVNAHRFLAQLLSAQGRRIESSSHVRELIRLKAVLHHELVSMVDLRGPFELVDYQDLIDRSQTTVFSVGEARMILGRTRGDLTKAASILKQVTEQFPSNTSASALYGSTLHRAEREQEFERWRAGLPRGIETEPEYWNVMGKWLHRQGRHQEAVRAFAEALRLDPTDRDSLREAIAVMNANGQSAETQTMRARLADLDKIFRIAKDADAEQAKWIASKLEELGRPWESLGWLIQSYQLSGKIQSAIPEINRRYQVALQWESAAKPGQVALVRRRQLLGFDAEKLPMPNLASRAATPNATKVSQVSKVPFRLVDVASTVGLNLRYESGFAYDRIDDRVPSSSKSNMYTFHVNGGGIAALDYDLDGHVDLYFSQAGGRPNDANGSRPNQMFRGLPGRFTETTLNSMTGDRGFGQGVCSGDINQDGFPDLLVANIGKNSIYLNQGDGTYQRRDDLITKPTNAWSSCFAVADLNGDSLPEIIEVNYLDDQSAYNSNCENGCRSPQEFTSGQDVVYRCQKDGAYAPWVEVTSDQPRLGLGILVTNFDKKHGNDFFVANDGDFNHFWSSTSAKELDSKFAMSDTAGVRGCRIGRDGNSQACMGIAHGDFDRDGTLDLHVTNYYNESNNLFLQTKDGFFSDESRKMGLGRDSLKVLGFGTQAIDFDHDGWLDLAVLNGHVDDQREEKNTPFQMRPQLFRGSSRGFKMQDSKSLGDAWQKKQLGRTLALIDFDRDGRMDVVGNYLDDPVSLLHNQTAVANWLQIELVGTASERDGIGAVVEITVDQQSWTAWQTAGDGYMCTNESVLHFGIGNADLIDEMTVRWPDGGSQSFSDLKANGRYLVVQGDENAYAR